MSHKFFGEHGKRYAQCVVCLKVLKWGERNHENRNWAHPFNHCGTPVNFITDERAHEILKGRPARSPGNRLKGRVASIESRNKRCGATR